MMHLLSIVALATAAADDPGYELPPARAALERVRQDDRPRRRRLVPPLRFGIRAGLRPRLNTSMVLDVGMQIARAERVKLDANLTYAVPHNLGIPGPWRSMIQVDQTWDLLFVAGPGLELGPTAGASYRTYRQDWFTIDNAWVPIAGLRISAPLVKSRRFSWALDARATVDLARTQMVIVTQEIREMHPVELQIGTRLNFGHGRRRARRER